MRVEAAQMQNDNDPVMPLEEMIRLAEGGDVSSIERLQARLGDRPTVVFQTGQLVRRSAHQLIQLIADGDAQVECGLRAELKNLRSRLLKRSDPPVLELMADEVALSWLHVRFMDHLCIGPQDGRTGGTKLVVKQRAAHCRYASNLRLHTWAVKLLRPRTPKKKAGRRAK
jgi:hypothetical protein